MRLEPTRPDDYQPPGPNPNLTLALHPIYCLHPGVYSQLNKRHTGQAHSVTVLNATGTTRSDASLSAANRAARWIRDAKTPNMENENPEANILPVSINGTSINFSFELLALAVACECRVSGAAEAAGALRWSVLLLK